MVNLALALPQHQVLHAVEDTTLSQGLEVEGQAGDLATGVLLVVAGEVKGCRLTCKEWTIRTVRYLWGDSYGET